MKQPEDCGRQSKFDYDGRKSFRKTARHSCSRQSRSSPEQGASARKKSVTSTATCGELFIVYYSKSLRGEHSTPNLTPSLRRDLHLHRSARKTRLFESY